MIQISHIPTDNDLKKIVNGVLSPSNGSPKSQNQLILLGAGLIAVGAIAAYWYMNNPIKPQKKKDS